MTRFFIRPDQIDGDRATLDADDALHLDRVLRAKAGDEIALYDGTGRRCLARIAQLSKSRAEAEIYQTDCPDTEPRVAITVAQSLPKTAEKLEWALQHGVEVGASGFLIFRSRRSEGGKLAEKRERWENIVKTAAEQSGRAKLPSIESLGGMDQILTRVGDYDLALFCDEAVSATPLREVLSNIAPQRIILVIGPEGGWADEEREAALAGGAKAVSLGKRVLRTETAALVGLSQTLYALGGG